MAPMVLCGIERIVDDNFNVERIVDDIYNFVASNTLAMPIPVATYQPPPVRVLGTTDLLKGFNNYRDKNTVKIIFYK